MGKIPGRTPALSRPTPEKTPENQAWKNLARPLRRCLQRSGHKRGIPAAKQERRKKMEQETTNLFRRKDTFFGICEAVGRDFGFNPLWLRLRSEEHTSELQSLMRISYAVFCLKKKKTKHNKTLQYNNQ